MFNSHITFHEFLVSVEGLGISMAYMLIAGVITLSILGMFCRMSPRRIARHLMSFCRNAITVVCALDVLIIACLALAMVSSTLAITFAVICLLSIILAPIVALSWCLADALG